MKKMLFLLLVLMSCEPAYATEYRGGFDDLFTAPRSDLQSHALVAGGCTVIGAYGLETLTLPRHDEVAAILCLAAVSSKEWLKDTHVDRGDLGANAVGALGGYVLKKLLPGSPLVVTYSKRGWATGIKFTW